MSNIKIRKITADDAEQLQQIARITFSETFSDTNTAQNMRKYLEEELSIDKLTKELNDDDSEFYLAESGDKIIGYLKLNFGKSQTELKEDHAVEIERIYVLKYFHGQRVGQHLYDYALHLARQKGADYIWLGVWERNERAINFYRKNGFAEFDKYIFKLGDEKQTDIMMKLQMR